MCEKHICNPDTKEPVWKMCTRCKLLLCFVLSARRPAIQAKLGDHLVIAMCSAAKPYFSHMSNDAVGCGWGEPTCHLGTTSTNCTKHLHDTPVRYTCEIRALDRADVRRLEVQLPSGLTAQCTYFTPLHPPECCSWILAQILVEVVHQILWKES